MLVGKQLSNGKYQPLAIVEYGFKPEGKQHLVKYLNESIPRLSEMLWIEPRLHCKVQYLEKTSTGWIFTIHFIERI